MQFISAILTGKKIGRLRYIRGHRVSFGLKERGRTVGIGMVL